MKKSVKKIIKSNILGLYSFQIYNLFKYYSHQNISKAKKILFLLKLVFKVRVYSDKSISKSIIKLFKKVDIKLNGDNYFVYNIDIYKTIATKNTILSNISIDYECVVKNSINDYRLIIEQCDNGTFKKNELDLLNGLEVYIDRLIVELENSSIKDKNKRISYLRNIKNKSANSFQEGLQRILFVNQILWQTNHRLNGLGRLDKILIDLYKNDIEKGVLSVEQASDLIKDFYKILHRDFWFKSNDLIGDTGQIIVLGGLDSNGNYLNNELTYLFLNCLRELQIPDPKILLRVSSKMPDKLLKASIECIKTGIGSPLFANDDIIIENLKTFGYDDNDVYSYTTSACWEPLLIGKSIGQNNIDYINFLQPLDEIIDSKYNSISTYDKLLESYIDYLDKYLSGVFNKLNSIKWETDPLLSLYSSFCLTNNLDISKGGSKYNDYGVTGVGLSNTINSLLIIKNLVFDTEKYSMEEIYNLKKSNDIKNVSSLYFGPLYGNDNNEVIELTNYIIQKTGDIFDKHKNKFHDKFKFGLSAPSYIIASKNFSASIDGRNFGEPFGVHISSKKPVAHTELVNFASKLNYSNNRINGNVVDFIVTRNFIENNFDKFVSFIKASIKKDFYEMQINVVSSKILIDAKKNPELYPNLIVRVWGFSAYFNDLPEEYKDLIIERALISESSSL